MYTGVAAPRVRGCLLSQGGRGGRGRLESVCTSGAAFGAGALIIRASWIKIRATPKVVHSQQGRIAGSPRRHFKPDKNVRGRFEDVVFI
jgi:hypothetical protein